MKVYEYARDRKVESADVIGVLANHDIVKVAGNKLSDEELAILTAHYTSPASPVQVAQLGEESSSAASGDVDEPESDGGVPDDLEADIDSPSSNEGTPKVSIEAAPRSGRRASSPRLTKTELKDRDIAFKIRAIQTRLTHIPQASWKSVEMDGRNVRLYRPKLELYDHEGTPFYSYPSLDPQEGLILLSVEDGERYVSGNLQRSHMLFVSSKLTAELTELFKGYSDFASKCSYRGCELTRVGKFSTGIDRKVQLIIRKRFLPPHFPVKDPQGATPVMDLRGMCFVHWLLGELKSEINPLWMQITVETQGLPVDQIPLARQKSMFELLDTVFDRATIRAKEGGERPPTRSEVGTMMVDFARQMTGELVA